ncbi:NifB/NifX family molybdenum-iron cluster-binding protein [Planctomycetota bacterium]
MNKILKDWFIVILITILVLSPWPILALSIKPKTYPHIVAIPTDGPTLSSGVNPFFARSRYFVIVDLKNNKIKAIKNPFKAEKHAVGLRIAHLLLDEKAGIVIAKNIGPEPFNNLSARGAQIYVGNPNTVQDAITQLNNNMLFKVEKPTVPVHYGLKQQK